MSQKPVIVLPFSVPSKNRSEAFTEDMEKAAIYCVAELEREKGEGLIIRKPEEKIAFLAKFGYPLWLMPWNKANMVFDGLKTVSYILSFRNIPDVNTFMENAQRSSKVLETYFSFLSDSANYFQLSENEKKIAVDALISDRSFLTDFSQYLSEAACYEKQPDDLILLPPIMEEPLISSIMKELDNIKENFQKDVDLLYNCIKLLNKTTRNFSKILRGKIRTIKDDFREKIREQEKVVAPEVDRINEEYDKKIANLEKNFKNQIFSLQKEKVKLEKTREQIREKIERYKMEAKASADKKDNVGEKKWKEKAKEAKKEFSQIEEKIDEIEDEIRKAEENNFQEKFKMRSELENKIKEAKRELIELEAARDAQILIHKQEIEKLERLTSAIIQQIDKVAKLREENIANFTKLGIPSKYENPTLVYTPFYLTCLQAEQKRRFIIFTPSIANTISFTTKVKSVLGKTKVRQLLAPRFKSIEALLNNFLKLIEQDAALEREISELGHKTNLLSTEQWRKQIRSGMEKIKSEAWISQKEHENMMLK